MNRLELLEKVFDEVHEQTKRGTVTKAMVERTYASIVKNIEKAVASGDSVELIGFGTFKAIDKKERTARNPQTGEEILVPAKRAVKFKPSSAFKEMVEKK